MSFRQYDLVLLGATGFTGKLTAQYIAQYLPEDLRWAIAGRSKEKLSTIIEEIALDSNFRAPALEVASLNRDDLTALCGKTRVLINTVGPYHKYSTPVIEACVEQGTHYLDVTGETPWVKDMIETYHTQAKKSGAIVIPQCGVESAPADVLTYVVASHLRKKTGLSIREVIVSLTRLSGQPSGGTLATVLGVFDSYGALGLAKAGGPKGYLPATYRLPKTKQGLSGIFGRLLGMRRVPHLGLQCLPILNSVDVPVIQRTWALLQDSKQPDAYGPNFRFKIYTKARSVLHAIVINTAAIVGPLMLAFPPVRWLLRRLVTQPGQGPSKEVEARGMIEQKGLALPDGGAKEKVVGSIRYKGGMYWYTALLVAEAAATILSDSDSIAASKMGGGFCTPATLGDAYADRLRERGVKLETQYWDQ